MVLSLPDVVPVLVCLLIVGLVLVSGRIFRSSPRPLRLGLGALGVVFIAIPVLCVAWFVGWLYPVQAYVANSKIDTLERHLYVGEKRTDIEKQLGRSIPKPDRRDVYGVSGDDIEAGMTGRLREYFYEAASSFCVQYYRGLVVYYDTHDRVTRWRRAGAGIGC